MLPLPFPETTRVFKFDYKIFFSLFFCSTSIFIFDFRFAAVVATKEEEACSYYIFIRAPPVALLTADAVEIVEGYGTHEASAKQKKAYWSEEDESKLTTVFQ
jgi:hypothetical protein